MKIALGFSQLRIVGRLCNPMSLSPRSNVTDACDDFAKDALSAGR